MQNNINYFHIHNERWTEIQSLYFGLEKKAAQKKKR